MFKFIGLVLLSALAAVGGERISINGAIDNHFERTNKEIREAGVTSTPIREIPLSPGVIYTDGVVLGLDSFYRTSDCWLELKESGFSFDLHYGLQFLTLVFPHLEIDGKNMSAYARVRDNSIHMAFTVHVHGEEHNVTLDDLRVEKMESVEFGASRPEYDGSNVDEYFKSVVIPAINKLADSKPAEIEDSFQLLSASNDLMNELVYRNINVINPKLGM